MLPKNGPFHDALMAYCKAALGVIRRQAIETDGLPLEISQEFAMEASNRFSQQYSQKIDWFAMHSIIDREMQQDNVQDNVKD
jgi:hypothetical protein